MAPHATIRTPRKRLATPIPASIVSAPQSKERPVGPEGRRQAGAAALAGRIPDGTATPGHRRGDPRGRGGLRRDERAGVPATLLLRPVRAGGRGAATGRRAAERRPVPGRPVRDAARELLPAADRVRRGGAERVAHQPVPAGGAIRLRRAPAARPAAPDARSPQPPRRPRRAHGGRQPAGQPAHVRGVQPPHQGRVGHQPPQDHPVPVLLDRARRPRGPRGGSLQPAVHGGELVPGGLRTRPRGPALLPAVAH